MSFAETIPDIDEPLEISDEELAVALLSPANQYEPMLIRIGSQLLSGRGIDAAKLARLAVMERCVAVLKYIATAGKDTEPQEPFWETLLKYLPHSAPIPDGVMPHFSRFRIEVGIVNPRSPHDRRIQWLRPSR